MIELLLIYVFFTMLWLMALGIDYSENRSRVGARLLLTFPLWPVQLVWATLRWLVTRGAQLYGRLWADAFRPEDLR